MYFCRTALGEIKHKLINLLISSLSTIDARVYLHATIAAVAAAAAATAAPTTAAATGSYARQQLPSYTNPASRWRDHTIPMLVVHMYVRMRRN